MVCTQGDRFIAIKLIHITDSIIILVYTTACSVLALCPAEEKKIKDKGTKKIWMIGH